MKGKESFVMYKQHCQALLEYDNETLGLIVRSLFAWQLASPSERDALQVPAEARPMYALVAPLFAKNEVEYEERCKKNRDNGKKGGEASARRIEANARRIEANARRIEADNDNDYVVNEVKTSFTIQKDASLAAVDAARLAPGELYKCKRND